MKKLILASLFALGLCFPAFALLVTDNVDRDSFQYEVPYQFASPNLGASLTVDKISIIGQTGANSVFGYTMPRSGRIVGIAVAGNSAITAGAATFDVTINDTVTGVQTVIEEGSSRTAIGNSGSSGSQFAYMRQDRSETAAHRGFKPSAAAGDSHNSEHPYGKASALSAGNRVGVSVTTSSGFSPTSVDYVVTVYVLE